MTEPSTPKKTSKCATPFNKSPKKEPGPKLIEIRAAVMNNFRKCDKNHVGYLTNDEFVNFINETRKSLFLSNADETIISKMLAILDPKKTDQISETCLFSNFDSIIHLIAKLGKNTELQIINLFEDFDPKRNGYLEINQLRLLFNILCDMLRLKRLEEWELDYLLNLLDDDGNRTIDLDEFMNNYLWIAQYLIKNQPQVKNKNDTLSFFDEMVKCASAKNKEFYIENLLQKYNFMKKQKSEEIELDECKIKAGQAVLALSKKSAYKIIPMPNLLEKEVIDEIKQNQRGVCDICKTQLSMKRKSMILADNN